MHQQISEKTSAESTIITSTVLAIGKPLDFNQNETHSFNEWLQLSTQKKIIRTTENPSSEEEKSRLIDRFIKQNPKIRRVDKHKEYQVKVSSNIAESSLMTETLAAVYLEQKKYENAIKAYQILSLKYPEKSGFFADQIKRVQILQKNKS